MKEQKKEIDLFGALNRLEQKIGLIALSDKLHELDLLHGDKDEEVIKQGVIDEVCLVVGIEKSLLMNVSYRSRNDIRQLSINFICCILKDNLDFDLNKIKVIFGLHESNISRRICSVRNLDRSNKIDLKIASIYDTVLDNLRKKKIIKK
jgi:hypothetical protein